MSAEFLPVTHGLHSRLVRVNARRRIVAPIRLQVMVKGTVFCGSVIRQLDGDGDRFLIDLDALGVRPVRGFDCRVCGACSCS